MSAVFYIAAVVAIVSTAMVVTRLNVAHALLYFIDSLFAVAVIFYVLGAPFAAALEVIIYAGAIMVLFLFVIMILNIDVRQIRQESEWLTPRTWIGPALLAGILAAEFIYILAGFGTGAYKIAHVGPKEVGKSLLGPYLLGVELASFLLLSGLVGAYHLGRRFMPRERKGGDY